MSAMAAGDGGPGGRPDLLVRKYSKAPADPRLAAWADRVIEILAADRARARHVFTADPETARRWKNALYDAAYKRWNRSHPDDQISLSANVIDPADGQCKARGAEQCTQNGCRPTPGRHGVHARVYAKTDGRAHQGAKDRESWDYDPLAPRPRRHRATTETAADPGPGAQVRRRPCRAGRPGQPVRCPPALTAGHARPGPGRAIPRRPASAGGHPGPAAPRAGIGRAAAAPPRSRPALRARAFPGPGRTARLPAESRPGTSLPSASDSAGTRHTTWQPRAQRRASPYPAHAGVASA